MAKKTNKKPGQNIATKSTNLAMKRRDRNLNHKRATKIVIYLMVLAFIGPVIAGLIIYFF